MCYSISHHIIIFLNWYNPNLIHSVLDHLGLEHHSLDSKSVLYVYGKSSSRPFLHFKASPVVLEGHLLLSRGFRRAGKLTES